MFLEGVELPINDLIKMFRWMGSLFHDWIVYNGIEFSTVTRVGSQIVRNLGKNAGLWNVNQRHQNV